MNKFTIIPVEYSYHLILQNPLLTFGDFAFDVGNQLLSCFVLCNQISTFGNVRNKETKGNSSKLMQ